MFIVNISEYEVCCQADGVPVMLAEYQQRALLAEDFVDPNEADAAVCFVSVGRVQQWPSLVVVQRYSPAGFGFNPGLIVVPETHMLFIGAGRRLLGYDLSGPTRRWEDAVDCGFYSWGRHGRVILMSAELELAAWDLDGEKLWSHFVEPPWEYKVSDGAVTIDVMGRLSKLNLRSGLPA